MIGHPQKVDFHPQTAGPHLQIPMAMEVLEVLAPVIHPLKRNLKRPPRSLKSLLNPQNVPMPTWAVAIAVMNPKASQPILFGKMMFKDVSLSSFPMNELMKSCQLSLVPIATPLMF